MNKNKVRGLKWNLKKFRRSILHFTPNVMLVNMITINVTLLTS